MTDEAMRHETAVVVPCYNVGGRLAPIAEELLALVDRVIFVDDGSTDESTDCLRGLKAQVVTHASNKGKGEALLTGFRRALQWPDAALVAVVDADGQHDPGELPRLYDAFKQHGADLVIGTRSFDAAHVPWRSRVGNKITVACTEWILGQRVPDTQSGYRLHSRRLIEQVVQSVSGGRYETEMEILILAVRGGYKVVSVPIQTIYEEGNPVSHFNKAGDSFRIIRRLIGAGLRRHTP